MKLSKFKRKTLSKVNLKQVLKIDYYIMRMLKCTFSQIKKVDVIRI